MSVSDYFAAGHSKAEFESLLQQYGTITEKIMDGDILDLSQFHLVSEKGIPKDVFDSPADVYKFIGCHRGRNKYISGVLVPDRYTRCRSCEFDLSDLQGKKEIAATTANSDG